MAAFAAPVTATVGYCVAPAPLTTSLALTDVTFTIGSTNYSPTDCYGLTDTGNSSVANNLAFVNGLRWEDFVNGVKADVNSSDSVTVDNISYTLAPGSDTGSGTNTFSHFTLSWSDTNGPAAPNLPRNVDFALQWNGGNNDAFYLFQNVTLSSNPLSGSGVIAIEAMNKPGNSDLGSSHLDLFLTNTSPPPSGDLPPPTVPEPATLLLIGSALLALAASQRTKARRRR
ncbi:MAG: PEP-CTERM sorting domain-containing protein [Pseudomonadota bacterium]|nr:PEP-CTERM sorting domain-containing protein [Pseudomonadota bacterium]